MGSIERNTQEEVVFIGRNYKRKQTPYEEESYCCTRKRLCCCCCIACLVTVVTVVGVFLAYILTRQDLSGDSDQWSARLAEGTSSTNFALNDTFTLVSYDNTYGDYLTAIGVPWFVKPLVLSGSESLTIGQTDGGAEMQTVTDYISQEMKFDWDTNFS